MGKDFNLEVHSNWVNTKNSLILRVTNGIQVRWFQFCIMRIILSTKRCSCKIGIKDSELCTFCNVYSETFSHLFL